MPVILKNTTESKMEYSFGDSIQAGHSEDFSHLKKSDLARCSVLVNAIQSGDVIVNDGFEDLSPSDAINFLNDFLVRASKVVSSGVLSKDNEGNVLLEADKETGDVKINGLKIPKSDGQSNQILRTDGNGNLFFSDLPEGQQGPVGPTGPAGSTVLSGLTDVQINTPQNGQTLKYDSSSAKWKNSNSDFQFPYYQHVDNRSGITTTSQDFIEYMRLTTPNLSDGLYKMNWSYGWNCSDKDKEFECVIYLQNSQMPAMDFNSIPDRRSGFTDASKYYIDKYSNNYEALYRDFLHVHVQTTSIKYGDFYQTGSRASLVQSGYKTQRLSGVNHIILYFRSGDRNKTVSIWNGRLDIQQVGV